MEIDPKSSQGCCTDKDVEHAKDLALRFLGVRAYTRREILGKLQRRKLNPQGIKIALAELERLGIINDMEFSQRFVEERMRLRPRGPQMLALELQRRGVDGQTVSQILKEAFALVDLEGVALELLRNRQRIYQELDRKKAFSRMFGFLVRRGFNASISRKAVERAWTEFGKRGVAGLSWEE